jgi:hypothetical protein
VKSIASGAAVVMTLTMGFCGLEADLPRLVAATFPDLPVAVVQELQSRGCKVPGKKSKSVIRGEFLRPGQTDWAVLCSAKQRTSLLVFPDGSRERVAALETRLKGFSKWSISVINREFLESIKSVGWMAPVPTEIDHQGISSFVESGEGGTCLYCYSAEGTTHYYYQDSWRKPQTTIVN